MKSIWHETSALPEFPKLNVDKRTSVLIIGGGITGILTAFFLHKNGVPYILAEKERICCGTTGNTTAKITYQHGLIYSKILKDYGIEKAQMYLQANKFAFDQYKDLCNRIDCGYEIKDNFVYSLTDRRKLENEMSALEKIGYHAKLCEEIPLPIETDGAVCFPEQAQFNPLMFLSKIAKNLNIFEHTFVRELIDNTAVTDSGRIYADKIIVTTHFPFINKHGNYFLKLYQNRSYVIALENAQNVDGMYVDENKKGLSFRNYEDMLIIGGGAHRTGKKGGNWEEIRRFAHQKYPDAHEKYFWAAQDCMSLDSMPYIGRYSARTLDLYTASGFNKWGITGSMVAAIMLSDMVMDRKNEYEDLFSPSRNIIRPQLFINGFEAAANLLSFSSKRCPHLGCALKWNIAEHSWDCPCHGSRFSENGKVMDNPANGNLNK